MAPPEPDVRVLPQEDLGWRKISQLYSSSSAAIALCQGKLQ